MQDPYVHVVLRLRADSLQCLGDARANENQFLVSLGPYPPEAPNALLVLLQSPLGGSFDLAATCSWAYSLTFSGATYTRPVREITNRVISPVVSGYPLP